MDLDPAVVSHAKLAFSSLAGGLVRLIFRPAESLGKAAWLLFGCVTCGFYGTPIFIAYYGVTDPAFLGGIGAAIGFIGLSVAGGVLQAVEAFNFRAVLGRFFGTK